MSTITLQPQMKIAMPQEPMQPRLRRPSVLGALMGKLAAWIEKESMTQIFKVVRRWCVAVSIGLLVFAHQAFIGYLTAVFKWNSYRVPIFLALLAVTMNAKKIWIWMRRKTLKKRTGNQHTVFGIAVSDLADFLTETMAFKKEDAQKRLAMSHGQWFKIAEALEKYGLLIRGESNARVLRPITREQLVLQLRGLAEKKYPPLAWDDTRQGWFERDGAFAQFVLQPEWKRRKLEEDVERKERKVERLEKKLSEGTAFQQILNMSA